jgi:hypothetical protein
MDNSDTSTPRSPVVFLVGGIALAVVAGLVFWVIQHAPAPAVVPEQPLAMGAAEQAYAERIEFLDPQVARAENFLNQEVTFVFGSVRNAGTLDIRQIEVQLEFHDVFRQVVLRDRQRLFGARAIPLGPGERRDFQLTYETMPAQWNQAYPEIEIIGLALE